jgi:hypothetical protein
MRREDMSRYKSLEDRLPASRIPFPHTFIDQIKFVIWWCYTPFNPFFRELFISLGLVSLKAKAARWGERQDFLLGTIAPTETIETIVEHLITHKYANHFIAWKDEGEVVGLRYVEDFKYQYHIRIFEDGEIRAHYEFTPESHIIRHNRADGFEHRREEFLKILGDKIIPTEASL